MREELLKGLTEEQIAKLNECNSAEEILSLAKEEGVQLSDEQLEAVSGGCGKSLTCPKCGSKNVRRSDALSRDKHYFVYKCQDCGEKFRKNC